MESIGRMFNDVAGRQHRADTKTGAGEGEIIIDAIKSGTLLIAEGALLPADLGFKSEPYVPGWGRVTNLDGRGMGRSIEEAGWTFFYIAGVIETIAFGSHEGVASDKALRRIAAGLKTPRFNCLEITQVMLKRFLGMPYVKVSAHSRHIQASQILFAD